MALPFDVFVSRSLAFLFPTPGTLVSPHLHSGETYYLLDAVFFAWASRTIPRALASNAVPAHYAGILEDMRIHLLHTQPDALTLAASLLASAAPIPLAPATTTTPPLPVEAGPPKRRKR